MSLHFPHYCPGCLQKQQVIDGLKEQIVRLKDRLRHQERMTEDENRDLDRQSRERVAMLQLARDIVMHPEAEEQIKPLIQPSEDKLNEG